MSNFVIVNNKSEIPSFNKWKRVFVSKEKIYTETGKSVTASYIGRKYRLIAKFERQFSFLERIYRYTLGIWRILSSLGRARNSPEVQKLFYRRHESKRYAVPLTEPLKRESKNLPQIESKSKSSEKKIDLTKSLPIALHQLSLSFLDRDSLAKSCLVSKEWHKSALDKNLWKAILTKNAVGKKEWMKLGDIGDVPPLPNQIFEILKKPCPFFPGKIIADTHMLIFIPETFDQKDFNFKYLFHLNWLTSVSHFWQGYRISFDSNLLQEFRSYKMKSHWILMTYDAIPKSKEIQDNHNLINIKNKCEKLIADYAMTTQLNYEIPSSLEVISSIYLNVANILDFKQQHLSNSKVIINTLCQENIRPQTKNYTKVFLERKDSSMLHAGVSSHNLTPRINPLIRFYI